MFRHEIVHFQPLAVSFNPGHSQDIYTIFINLEFCSFNVYSVQILIRVMDAKQQKIIIDYLQNGYDSMDNLVKESKASKGSIHAFCKNLVSAGIATRNPTTRKYGIKVDNELRDNLLANFLSHELTTSELGDKIKSQREDTGPLTKLLKQKAFQETLKTLLDMFESQGFLHSHLKLDGELRFELTRTGYSKQNACYICHEKFNESDNTIVSQNTGFQDQRLDEDNDVELIERIDNLLIHPQCAQRLTLSDDSCSKRSLCSFCGFPVSPTVFKNKLIQYQQEPKPHEFRRFITKHCRPDHKIGMDYFFKTWAENQFKENLGIEIPKTLLKEINWSQTSYPYQIDKTMQKAIIEHAKPRLKSEKWYKELKSHNFKAHKTFTAYYQAPNVVLSEIFGITGARITLEAVREWFKLCNT